PAHRAAAAHRHQLHIVKRPRRYAWCDADQDPPPMPDAFPILKKRWIVERTFAWLGRFRRPSKDFEQRTDVAEAFVCFAISALMLRRITSV
ncbi:MAG: transposase, partial [Myxococcota bacterium]